jgi:hypothetical protein
MWLATHTQQQNPHRILLLLLQHGLVSEIGQKFRDKVNQSKHHYFPTSPQSQRSLELPQDNRYSSRNKTHPILSSKSPETSCMNYHTTTLEILNMFILSFVGPYKNTCNNSGPFLNILSIREVFSSGFFSFNPLDQILFLLIYNTPKSKSNHTF